MPYSMYFPKCRARLIKDLFISASHRRSRNWPGYNYLGPGNSISNVEPINSVDDVAREHDIAYGGSKTYEDIMNADRIAIEKFRIEYEKTGKLPAKVAELVLRAKTTVEKHARHTLYPWNMPKATSPTTETYSSTRLNVPHDNFNQDPPLEKG